MNWKATFEGLAAAILGGAVGQAAQAVESGYFDWAHVKSAAVAGAIIALAAYFKPPATKPKPQADAEPPTDPGPQG